MPSGRKCGVRCGSHPLVLLSGSVPVHKAGRKALNYLSLGIYKVLWNVLHGMSAPFLHNCCFMRYLSQGMPRHGWTDFMHRSSSSSTGTFHLMYVLKSYWGPHKSQEKEFIFCLVFSFSAFHMLSFLGNPKALF